MEIELTGLKNYLHIFEGLYGEEITLISEVHSDGINFKQGENTIYLPKKGIKEFKKHLNTLIKHYDNKEQ